MSFASLFENALVQALSTLILIFMFIYVGWSIFIKAYPDWKERLKNHEDKKP